MAQAGAVLGGRYLLAERIGNGGYSQVWRAADTVLSRCVAVKLLHPRYADRGEALARFQAEAKHAGALSHDNIARVYDYGEPADGQPPYLVMELVDGTSLEAVLAGGPLSVTRTMDVIAQAAAGLQAAHAVGVIHRDIKPANLLLARDGTVKVADFGIAHSVGSVPLTLTGELIGTPGYLAPERVSGAQATAASDLYGLGTVAYECLAGARPFTGTALEVALAHCHHPLPPLPASVPADVAALVMQLSAKDPAWRPGSAGEVAAWAALLRDGFGEAAPLLTGPPAQRAGATPSRRRAVLAAACVAVTAVMVLVVASVIGFASTPHAVSGRSAVPSGPSHGSGVAAQPAGRPSAGPGRPSAGPGRLPAASPVARREPAGTAPGAAADRMPAHSRTSGHQHADDPRSGHGKAKGHGKTKGKGDGNTNGNGQTLSVAG